MMGRGRKLLPVSLAAARVRIHDGKPLGGQQLELVEECLTIRAVRPPVDLQDRRVSHAVWNSAGRITHPSTGQPSAPWYVNRSGALTRTWSRTVWFTRVRRRSAARPSSGTTQRSPGVAGSEAAITATSPVLLIAKPQISRRAEVSTVTPPWRASTTPSWLVAAPAITPKIRLPTVDP